MKSSSNFLFQKANIEQNYETFSVGVTDFWLEISEKIKVSLHLKPVKNPYNL